MKHQAHQLRELVDDAVDTAMRYPVMDIASLAADVSLMQRYTTDSQDPTTLEFIRVMTTVSLIKSDDVFENPFGFGVPYWTVSLSVCQPDELGNANPRDTSTFCPETRQRLQRLGLAYMQRHAETPATLHVVRLCYVLRAAATDACVSELRTRHPLLPFWGEQVVH